MSEVDRQLAELAAENERLQREIADAEEAYGLVTKQCELWHRKYREMREGAAALAAECDQQADTLESSGDETEIPVAENWRGHAAALRELVAKAGHQS